MWAGPMWAGPTIYLLNGWVIKIGRGLDFYQTRRVVRDRTNDLSLRKCLETKVDIYRVSDSVVA
ncbi:MAG: MIT C-terminal domain-containing protein [Pseudorhizobium sp.]